MAESDRIRERVPVSTFIEARVAQQLFKSGQYGEAADHARSAIAKFRGVPAPAVELSDGEASMLQTVVMTSAAATRKALERLRKSKNPALASDIAEHEDLAAILDKLTDMLNTGRAVYIVPGDEPSMDLEKVQ